jgi:hypothetical protein
MWSFDLDTHEWEPLPMLGAPPDKVSPVPRRCHTANLCLGGDQIVFFGGMVIDANKGRSRATNEVWMLDVAAIRWRKLEPTGTPPTPRSSHSATLVHEHTLVVLGGVADNISSGECHLLDLAPLATGGVSSGVPTWTQVGPIGHGPGPLYGHTALVNPWYDDSLLVFGGRTVGGGSDGATWRFDMKDHAWALERTTGQGAPPGSPFGHCSLLVYGWMVVFGGSTRRGFTDGSVYALQVACPPHNVYHEQQKAEAQDISLPGLIDQIRRFRKANKERDRLHGDAPSSRPSTRSRSVMKACDKLMEQGLRIRESHKKGPSPLEQAMAGAFGGGGGRRRRGSQRRTKHLEP